MSRHKRRQKPTPVVVEEPIAVVKQEQPPIGISFEFLPDVVLIGSMILFIGSIVGQFFGFIERNLTIGISQIFLIVLFIWILYRGYMLPLE